MAKLQLWQKLQHPVVVSFNKTYGFWDRSVYVPDDEVLPEANEMIRDILRRQLVITSRLARRPAKERKQAAKTKAYKVQKQTVERNLLPRNLAVHAHPELHTSQVPAQHTIAAGESAPGSTGPSSPGFMVAGPPDNRSNGVTACRNK
ncbi:hypothetical protein CEP54_016079 [Fusarium duplospermum]|uniref:Uncharacterized protein n=1 Tax=Fusarium duplospermum TaxID=1325734 RepID=A0A428NII2_9HYPO|nr:hypothetical protein CEP54_016079 [Fusarium duplospermum]